MAIMATMLDWGKLSLFSDVHASSEEMRSAYLDIYQHERGGWNILLGLATAAAVPTTGH